MSVLIISWIPQKIRLHHGGIKIFYFHLLKIYAFQNVAPFVPAEDYMRSV